MHIYLYITLKAVFSFMLLLTITGLIGKHINSNKNHFSFALSIVIGSIIANMAIDPSVKFKHALIVFVVLVITFYLLLILTFKNRKIKKYLSGTPTIIIENGELIEDNMRRMRLTMSDLKQRFREHSIFDIHEIETAYLEPSGQLSFQKKKIYQPLTTSDIHKIFQQFLQNQNKEKNE